MSDRKLASIYTERLSTTVRSFPHVMALYIVLMLGQLTAACGLVSGCMTLGLLGYLVVRPPQATALFLADGA
jgi:hypothetical protein